MLFALFGDHEDGLAIARALAESGRHQLRCYSGPAEGAEYLRRWNLAAPNVPDMEEALADPLVEMVIVAGAPATRAAQLRRALQAERHVLCVHPADERADTAYEAASMARETGCVLMPLLPGGLHPGLARLADLIARDRLADKALEAAGRAEGIMAPPVHFKPAVVAPVESLRRPALRPSAPAGAAAADGLPPVSLPRLLELEFWSREAVLLDADTLGHEPGFPGWEMLRRLAGEVVEVSAFGAWAEVQADDPILLAGRFAPGGLFHATLLPNQPEALLRLSVLLRFHRAELIFTDGWPGPARLTWTDEQGQPQAEHWESWNPWPPLVEAFEQAVAAKAKEKAAAVSVGDSPMPTWEDEIRCLELDHAARRSLEHRRSSVLEFQEDIEEATFKGTMTLAGCALLWATLVLLILARWLPWLGYVILPIFVVFLGLQLLRWVIPSKPPEPNNVKRDGTSGEK